MRQFYISFILFVQATQIVAQVSHVTFNGYHICGKSVKRISKKVNFQISIVKQFTRNDTIYSKLYDSYALGVSCLEYAKIKSINDKYFIASDFTDTSHYYEFFDLHAKEGAKFESDVYCYQESTIVLKSKQYSTVLRDTLVYFSIDGRAPSHSSCPSEFVFAKEYGFLRFKGGKDTSCEVLFYPSIVKKWKRKKDKAISELIEPILRRQ